MAGNAADRVLEQSTNSGQGSFTLNGAVAGYQSFNSAFGTNTMFRYCIETVDSNNVPTGDWEVGRTWLSAASTLLRDASTVIDANSAGTLVRISFADTVTKNVFNNFSSLAARKTTHMFDLAYGLP